jgi:hypothetical protein
MTQTNSTAVQDNLVCVRHVRSVPFTLQPNKKQSHSVPDYQTHNRAAPFLDIGMERLRCTWLFNQTLPYVVSTRCA